MSTLVISAIPCTYEGGFVQILLSTMIRPYTRTFEVKSLTDVDAAVAETSNDPNVTGKDIHLSLAIKKGQRKPSGFDRWEQESRRKLYLHKEAAPVVAETA